MPGIFFFAARLITVTSRRRFRNLMSPAGNESQSSLASCFPSFRTLRLYHKSPHVSLAADVRGSFGGVWLGHAPSPLRIRAANTRWNAALPFAKGCDFRI